MYVKTPHEFAESICAAANEYDENVTNVSADFVRRLSAKDYTLSDVFGLLLTIAVGAHIEVGGNIFSDPDVAASFANALDGLATALSISAVTVRVAAHVPQPEDDLADDIYY